MNTAWIPRHRIILAAVVALTALRPVFGDISVNLGRGSVVVHVPPSYDDAVSAPLVILLHGYGGSGATQEAYMNFAPLSDEYGFLYAYPDGIKNSSKLRFWNATDVCCDFADQKPDDSQYLTDLVDAVRAGLHVDDRRIYFIGHSNGGFMSYRMACDHSQYIAAIVSLAGATWFDPERCYPQQGVHVLQIHGTSDDVIQYDGGCGLGKACSSCCYPGGVADVEQWAAFGGCALDFTTTKNVLDLDSSISGQETDITTYPTNCGADGGSELWTINRGQHVPTLSPDFSRAVIEWLLAHPKSPATTCRDLNCAQRRFRGH